MTETNGDHTLQPSTSPGELRQLAIDRPDLWESLWTHPSMYPDLQEWMVSQGFIPPPTASLSDLVTEVPSASPLGNVDTFPGPSTPNPQTKRQRKPKWKPAATIGSAVATIAILAGTAFAITNPDRLPSFSNSDHSSANTVSPAKGEHIPTLADGLEPKWTIKGEDLMRDGELRIWGPRQMPNITESARNDYPTRLTDGLIFSVGRMNHPGTELHVIDPITGRSLSSDDTKPAPLTCSYVEDGTEAYCLAVAGPAGAIYHATQEGYTEIVQGIGGLIDETSTDMGDVNNVDSPNTMHLEGKNIVVSGYRYQWTLNTSGEILDLVNIPDGYSGEHPNRYDTGCRWVRAAGVTSFIGPYCNVDPTTIISHEDSINWAIVGGPDPIILLQEQHQLKAVDPQTREALWSVPDGNLGWYEDPQLVDLPQGQGVLVASATYGSSTYSIIELRTGNVIPIPATNEYGPVVVAENYVVEFSGSGYEEISSATVYDPATGNQVGYSTFDPVYEVVHAIGGPNGILLSHPACTKCSTAEGSNIQNRFTFMGPVSNTEAGIVSAAIEAPSTIPASCPANTILIGWAELDDGWLIVCGVTMDEPTYVAYQPSSQGATQYSRGRGEPTGHSTAITWSPKAGRYIAELENGHILTFDYDMATVTVWDPAKQETLNQHRTIRYVFVPWGQHVRTVEDVVGQEGTFSVSTPEDTSEDQIRYMIEVLEKAYEGRALVREALPKLQACSASSGGYEDTVRAMESVRDNRAELLDALESIPVDKIPDGTILLNDLREGIDASHRANLEYVVWAENANANGCAKLSSAGQQAVNASDPPKERFADRWNRVIAGPFGVRTFDSRFI